MRVGANRIAAQALNPLDLLVLVEGGLGEGLDLLVLGLVHEGGVDGQDVAQRLAEAVHPLGHDGRVVGGVAQVSAQLLIGPVLLEPRREAGEHGQQRTDGALELDDLLRQLVDAAAHLGVATEDLGLDLVDVLLQPGHHRRVAVHHAVHDGVQDRLRPQPQELGVALHPPAHGAQVRGQAVADGDDEIGTDEDMDLPEVHLLHVVEVGGRLEDDEQHVVVALELGPLVGDDGVLQRDLVQPELVGHVLELGVGRPEQTDPGHGARLSLLGPLAEVRGRVRDRGRALDPLAVVVQRGVDHALLDRGLVLVVIGLHGLFGSRALGRRRPT